MLVKLKPSDRLYLLDLLSDKDVIELRLKKLHEIDPCPTNEEMELEERRIILRHERLTKILQEAETEEKGKAKRV